MFNPSSRRQFLGGVGGVAGALALASRSDIALSASQSNNQSAQSATNSRPIIKPPALKSGDTIALVAPAAYAEPEEIITAKKNMERYGFKVVFGKNLAAQYGYLAGTDQQRADDINEMFGRSDIKGIATFMGGFGCSRILPLLDYELIRNNPKVIIGHSDITALLLGIHTQTGLITFHGSSGLTGIGDYAISHFQRAIMNPNTLGEVAKPTESLAKRGHPLTTFVGGSATGELIGGNLSLVVNLIGTAFEPDTTGKILFLEDIGEIPWRVDRMLTQLSIMGKLQAAAGFALGPFISCIPETCAPNPQPTPANPCECIKADPYKSFTVEEVLRQHLEPLGKPTVYNFSFGHVEENAVIPLGAIATLDATNQKLIVNENAVV